MRDALWITGDVAAAVKDTTVYSADTVDTGAASPVLEGDLYVCFQHTGLPVAADSYVFHLQTSGVSDFSSNTALYTFPQTETNIPTGKVFRYRAPADVKRYIRAAVTPKSSGTFTATTVKTWLELGQRK